MKVVIIDTGCANISSVKFAVQRLGYEVEVSRDHQVIQAADKIFLPGVGAAAEAMGSLKERGLIDVIRSLTQPVLGICLGMQLLAESSAEGETGNVACLGLLPCKVEHLTVEPGQRLPHMGWNSVTPTPGHPLFKDIEDGTYFYFVHSFAIPVGEYTAASCDYGRQFSAAISWDNFYGVQFHPERSAAAGATLIKNFLEL
jgi:glutamine amidotransferase